ncbi:MAG: folylpolyglutamate synthase/dihydrofolate synthase family protein [Planctomycetota bacterium]
MSSSPDATHRDAAVRWLYSRINYEATSPIPYTEQGMKLDRMRELAHRLGDPQDKLRVIHVAGTKGKGSTAAMIAAALQAAGQRVGVYSSPHFESIEERFAVNGEPCSAAELVHLIEQVRPVAEAMDAAPADGRGPTFFDLTTAIALLHFAQHAVSAAVIEVGLGGRLDSTNIVAPEVAVITSISRDHTAQLGDTVERIAAEKAGIIKPGVAVVSGVGDGPAGEVIERAALAHEADFWRAGDRFTLLAGRDSRTFHWRDAAGRSRSIEGVRVGMAGEHQAANAATALATLCVLAEHGWPISAEAMRRGVAEAQLPGRVERFAGGPPVIIDGAHNDASAAALARSIDELCGGVGVARRVLVVAIAADKDRRAILAPLVARVGFVIATRFVDNPRASQPSELAATAQQVGDSETAVRTAEDPASAYELAKRLSGPTGAVIFAGSLLFAAEARRLVLAERGAPPSLANGV